MEMTNPAKPEYFPQTKFEASYCNFKVGPQSLHFYNCTHLKLAYITNPDAINFSSLKKLERLELTFESGPQKVVEILPLPRLIYPVKEVRINLPSITTQLFTRTIQAIQRMMNV
jgi:hypothetical protein